MVPMHTCVGHHASITDACLQDGRQRGEVQLSISFLPADAMQASFTTPHSSPLQPQPHSPDTDTASPRSTSGACSSSTSKATTPAAESNLLSSELKGVPLPDQGDLGPLGKSLMALSMTHISPSQTRAQVLTDSNGMSHSGGTTRLSQDVGVTPHRTSPAAVASSSAISGAAVSSAAASHAVNAAPPKRNFYPEMIVEDEQAYSWAEASQSHHSNAADTVVAAGSRLQQTADTAASVLAPGEAMGNASYSAQEVYTHQYALHATTASQHSHSIDPQQTQQQQQQQQHSPEPSWYSQGSDPRPGNFQQSGLALATQGTQARQGVPTQPYASHFHLLGTTPLHDGQHGQQLQYQSDGCDYNAGPQYPQWGTPQDPLVGQPAYLYQSYGQQAMQQTDIFRPVPAWRLAGTSPLHDGYGFSATEATAIGLHSGGAVQPLTYAGMAVKSWSTQAKRPPVLPHRASNFDDSQAGHYHCNTCLDQIQRQFMSWRHLL